MLSLCTFLKTLHYILNVPPLCLVVVLVQETLYSVTDKPHNLSAITQEKLTTCSRQLSMSVNVCVYVYVCVGMKGKESCLF